MTGALRRVNARRLSVPATALAAVAAVAALVALRWAGDDGFASHPVGAAALAAGAVAAAVVAVRLRDAGHPRAAVLATWLGVALLAYLVAAVWAVAAVSADAPSADVAVAVWNAAWIPPLALGQLTVSAAVRRAGAMTWDDVLVAAALTVMVMTTLVLVEAADPFAGVPTVAPEAWRQSLVWLDGLATAVGLGALLVLPVRLWRAALSSTGPAHAGLGIAAAGTTAAPLTVAFCLLLAVVRDPGAVDPALGSVAFLVTLSAASAFAAACAVLATGGGRPGAVLVTVRAVGTAGAGLVVLGLGTVLAAPGPGLGATAVALLIAALAVAMIGGAWTGTGRLAAALEPPPVTPAVAAGTPVSTPVPVALLPAGPVPPRAPDPGPGPLPGLTRRESEVLVLLAEGASNAGIAARLVVSERTVDAHLRSVFSKLDLTPAPEHNRRVQAARIWLEHQG